ncbi:hypothetical protein SS50377_23811 [Spironucleus salmonicida]|uniref:Transmembrane protein n=1 Tax=Spironucleus salmonicida TaxID=348837 RepID=V6LPF6_9EUKA|nr:hypothetical protein SS50377_23811 [Spironucleus salmonicida]|eukprot:EST46490.1 Hypothetical protein SS50377_13571 [Spironucleus salmonicida]
MSSQISSLAIHLDSSLAISDDDQPIIQEFDMSAFNYNPDTVTIQLSERPLTHINSPVNNESRPDVELRLFSAMQSSSSQASPPTNPTVNLTPATQKQLSSPSTTQKPLISHSQISNSIPFSTPNIGISETLKFPQIQSPEVSLDVLFAFRKIVADFEAAEFDLANSFVEVAELKLHFYEILSREIVEIDEICNVLILLSLNQEEEKVSLSEMARRLQALGVPRLNLHQLQIVQLSEQNRVLEGLLGRQLEAASAADSVVLLILSMFGSFLIFLLFQLKG